MTIIPVIDILNGLVVHARHGERSLYQPISSRLCHDPSPFAVIKAFLSLFPFNTIYIADLNAIMHKGDNRQLIVDIVAEYSELHFWIDAGQKSPARDWPEQVCPIIGTETGISLKDLKDHQSRNNYILSLDFRNGGLIGNPELLSHPEYWPDKIIIMSLDKVGSHSGPDTGLIASIQSLTPNREIFIAGGIRESRDLFKLAGMGINGVLIASALHNQNIDRADLATYKKQIKKTPA